MKYGMRKPNIKKSIKVRTTGRVKRKMKKAVNPLYGKKGIGYVKNPEKAFKNKLYHKTTFGINDVIKNTPNSRKKINSNLSYNKWIDFCLCLFLGFIGAHKFYERKYSMGIIYLFTLGLFCVGWIFDIFYILFKKDE